MKTLFINPPFLTEHGKYSRTSRSPSVTKSGTVYYPIWLAYAAAYSENKGIDIDIVDSCATRLDESKTLDIIKSRNPDLSLIIMDTSTPSIESDIKYCDILRNIYPESLIFLMGTHVSALPEETLNVFDKSKSVDGVIKGEADITSYKLAKLCNINSRKEILKENLLMNIKGIIYRGLDFELVQNEVQDQITDLDSLPFVSQLYSKYMDVNDYFFAASDNPEIQIITSRGCVARCTFCVYPHTIHKLKYRMRSAESVFNEFKWVSENMPQVRVIGIEDDTFSGSKKRTQQFCRMMIKSGINKKIKWYSNERANLDRKTMEIMRKAGCHMITIGYESANQNILDNIDKKITLKQILEFNRNAKLAKIRIHGCFMVGNYGESRKTLNDTLKFALKLNDDTMQFFPLIVYPGTPDYDRFTSAGLLEVSEYRDYLKQDGRMNGVVKTIDMSADELTDWCDYARKKYYLRFSYIMKKFLKILVNFDDFKRTVKSFSIFYKHLLRPVKYSHNK